MKLILNGGGVGKSVESARQLLSCLIDNSKKILYIPFAWLDTTYDGCLEFMTDELSDVDKAGIDMVKTPEELMDKDFNHYACLYIGGGNTYKLLNDLKTSGAFDKIKKYLLEYNGIVYGGSAGAIIFGKDLDSCNTDDENEVGLVDNTGFDMINGYSLLCHYTNRGFEKTELSRKYLLELSKTKPVYAIPEEDTIFVDGDKIEFIGDRYYYEFINGIDNKREIKIGSMKKYVRVMDGIKSNAGGFEYKLDEINISNNWNTNENDPDKMGGFNFGSEDKILRWLHRGDTIYDVIIPEDAEIVLCNEEKGVWRANKIIVKNPQIITDEMVIELYKKTTLSNKVLAQCLQTLLWKNRIEVSKFIINDRVNIKNVDEFIMEFENYAKKSEKFNYDELSKDSKKIYNMLKEIKSNYNKL